MPNSGALKAFRKFSAQVARVPALEKSWGKLLMGVLPRLPGMNLSPVIRYRKNRWVME